MRGRRARIHSCDRQEQHRRVKRGCRAVIVVVLEVSSNDNVAAVGRLDGDGNTMRGGSRW